MNKLQCDRCGAISPKNWSQSDGWISLTWGLPPPKRGGIQNKDLCPNCYQNFLTFIEKSNVSVRKVFTLRR